MIFFEVPAQRFILHYNRLQIMQLKPALRKIKLLRKAKSNLASLPGRVGSILLKNDRIRSLLNDIYNTNSYNSIISPLLGKPRIDVPFNWRLTFRNKEILLPVLPNLDRSWNAALVWGWEEYKEFRAFYEFYLDHTPGADIFWDIGANDGTHTYLLASQGFKCTSFEPQPSCIEYIQKVIQTNNFRNVEIVQTALGNQDSGTIDFFISQSSWYSSTKKESVERFEESTLIKVPITNIESYRQKSKDVPNLIKIDVEGFEWEVIKGGGVEFFQSVKPTILIEVDTTTSNLEAIYNFLEPLGFKIYQMVKGKSTDFIAENVDASQISAFPQKGNVDFIILPAGSFRDKFEQKLVRKN